MTSVGAITVSAGSGRSASRASGTSERYSSSPTGGAPAAPATQRARDLAHRRDAEQPGHDEIRDAEDADHEHGLDAHRRAALEQQPEPPRGRGRRTRREDEARQSHAAPRDIADAAAQRAA